MKNSSFKILFTLIFTFFFIQSCFSYQDEEITKTFKKKENLKISVASANCFLKKSNSDEIKIKIVFTYDKNDYVPEFTEESNELKVKEIFKEHNMSGKAQWFIEIPDNTNITVNSASGDIEAEDLKGKLKVNTASGDVKLFKISDLISVNTASGNVNLTDVNSKITIKTASGDVSLSNAESEIEISTASGDIKSSALKGKMVFKTASGDISINKLEGEIKSSTASGDIEISNLSLTKATSFAAVSGDIRIKLSKSLSDDISFSTVSGNVKLDFNGNSTDGYYEFAANTHSGGIKAPSDFELVSSNSDDHKTEKTYKSGTGKPKIKMSTVSGTLSIEK
jgi:DUF4097 and DUF4098 domain-containing protein YvlB